MSRAVRYSSYGGPEVLDLVDVEEPHAGPGKVRVAVRSAGLNPFDYKVRRGGYLPNHVLPSGQGAEFAGIIDEVGPEVDGSQVDGSGVDGWHVGESVLGWMGRGAQAEYVVVPANNLARKPLSLDWEAAGGVGLVGNTAKRATDSLALGATDTVFVSGVTGGVGLLSAQFARRTGATVIGTASERNHDFLRGLGIVPVSYGPGILSRLRSVAPQGFTAVLDSVGGEFLETALSLGVPAERINTIADYAAAERYGLGTIGGGNKTAKELDELARMVASGDLVLPVRASYPLAEVQAAYLELETGHGVGKVILTIP